MRLASSGVSEVSLGSCWGSLMTESTHDEPDGELRGAGSGMSR
jgi:hypothetical protein